MKKTILLLIVMTGMVSCTENSKAKNYGGVAKMELEPGQKVVNVTWKEDDLWILSKDMAPTDTAQTYIFHEKSSYGILEGTYIIKEQTLPH